ncbi:Na+/H+ antiporter subunit E [Rhizobium helianthi]|uniref:Na+/H+ antiporter subunit E n=1 Tax=Rhizobium helianthi TaxID=1132695 RepID=A0ABW4M8C0_9HYPH
MLPFPLLTLCLTFMWMLLNSFTLGHLILGSIVAVVAGWSLASLRPEKPRLKKWYLLPRLFAIVFADIIRSNIAVARLVLAGKRRKATSGFLLLPLELQNPFALAILAVIVTSTPGSAWLEYDSRARTVLIHVLDLIDQEEWIAMIKQRYEALLMEIFA